MSLLYNKVIEQYFMFVCTTQHLTCACFTIVLQSRGLLPVFLTKTQERILQNICNLNQDPGLNLTSVPALKASLFTAGEAAT